MSAKGFPGRAEGHLDARDEPSLNLAVPGLQLQEVETGCLRCGVVDDRTRIGFQYCYGCRSYPAARCTP